MPCFYKFISSLLVDKYLPVSQLNASANIWNVNKIKYRMSKKNTHTRNCKLNFSLNPLIICLKFAGIDMLFCTQRSVKANLLFYTLSAAIFFMNLITNGPRFLYLIRFDFFKAAHYCEESSWVCLEKNPAFLVKFSFDLAGILLTCYIPVIHFAFFIMTTVLPFWRNISSTINTIQLDMVLDKRFYKTCRKKCLLVTFLLVLVIFFVSLILCFNAICLKLAVFSRKYFAF